MNSFPCIKKTFYIEHLGCAKNLVDGEALEGLLSHRGMEWVDSPAKADYIFVNTCGFIQSAKQESLDVTLELRTRFPGKRIVLTGCLSQRYGSELFTELSEVDGIFGNKDLYRISEFLEKLESEGRVLLIPSTVGDQPRRLIRPVSTGSTFIKIAEGCWNRCSYCAIPIIRGDLRSRGIEEILEEIQAFLHVGVREFNLIAQDIGSYGFDRKEPQGLVELLRQIQRLPDNFWIRLLYIHPEHFPLGILDLCLEDARFLPYFDIPFQHASLTALQSMGRKQGAEENLQLIRTIREKVPEAILRSTLLVGFPGEAERDFEELVQFQKQAQFDWLGVFEYSQEEGTAAAEMDRKRKLHVPKRIALARKVRILEVQEGITSKRLDRFVGRELEVLIEERVEGRNLSLGRAYLNAPEVDGLILVHTGQVEPGERVRVRIAARNGIDLEAVVLPSAGA